MWTPELHELPRRSGQIRLSAVSIAMTRYGLSCRRHGCGSPGSRLISYTRTCSFSKTIPWPAGPSSIGVPSARVAMSFHVIVHAYHLGVDSAVATVVEYGCAVESAPDLAVSTAS